MAGTLGVSGLGGNGALATAAGALLKTPTTVAYEGAGGGLLWTEQVRAIYGASSKVAASTPQAKRSHCLPL